MYVPPELLLPELKLLDPELRPPPARASATVSRTMHERKIMAIPRISVLNIFFDRVFIFFRSPNLVKIVAMKDIIQVFMMSKDEGIPGET